MGSGRTAPPSPGVDMYEEPMRSSVVADQIIFLERTLLT